MTRRKSTKRIHKSKTFAYGHTIAPRVSEPLKGKSVTSKDKKITALHGGKRATVNPHYYHGRLIRKATVYYERRRNRADKDTKKKL